jgi:hypothetical protein
LFRRRDVGLSRVENYWTTFHKTASSLIKTGPIRAQTRKEAERNKVESRILKMVNLHVRPGVMRTTTVPFFERRIGISPGRATGEMTGNAQMELKIK